MAPSRPQPKGYIRQRGSKYWIAVPRGTDPITRRYRYVYDSAATRGEAERKRDELIERLCEGREPAEKATVSMLLDRWMDVADLALSTRVTHESYIERVIRPVLGDWPVRKLERRVDILDQLYAHLRRCSKLCDGRPFTEHRTSDGLGGTDAGHDCAVAGCLPHRCRPMAASTIRRIHSNISAAFGFAIKWGWVDRNPADHASPPRLNRPDIEPPDPAQVARLLDVAWKRDPDFGTFLWMAVVTGARRGELVAIRWTDIRWQEADLLIARGYVSHRGQRVIKDTKTHQKRRLSLDAATIEVLRAHLRRREEICSNAGVPFRADGYLFTSDGFGEEPWLPDSMTQRFLCLRDDQALAIPASMDVRL